MGYSEMANAGRNVLCLDRPFIINLVTSGKYHLAPCFVPTANLSLVGTCWTANGLNDAIVLLNESINLFIQLVPA